MAHDQTHLSEEQDSSEYDIPTVDVAIVGAGLSGLSCANLLQDQGISYVVIEAQDQVGGRIHTDEKDGFLMDRGFQVYNTGYEEANLFFDLTTLDMKSFYSGAVIRYKGAFNKLGDPQRDPGMWLFGLYSSIGSFKDKTLTFKLKQEALRMSAKKIWETPEVSTREFLIGYGFSEGYIERFFVPFYGGIFLEKDLKTSVRKFLFTFKTFGKGVACLPNGGMQAMPKQLAERLDPSRIWLGNALIHVSSFNPETPSLRILTLEDGSQVYAKHVVMATPLKETCRLLGEHPPLMNNGTVNIYFAFEGKPPLAVRGNTLLLNGESEGMMLHCCFVSEIAPGYAPEGHSLFSVTLNERAFSLSEKEAVDQARREIKSWFGPVVERWDVLGYYPVFHAVPSSTVLYGQDTEAIVQGVTHLEQKWNVLVASDAMDSASINGAIRSGQQAAAHINYLMSQENS